MAIIIPATVKKVVEWLINRKLKAEGNTELLDVARRISCINPDDITVSSVSELMAVSKGEAEILISMGIRMGKFEVFERKVRLKPQ